MVELTGLEQKNYTVSVSRITLEQAIDFLWEVEGKGYPLRITNGRGSGHSARGESKSSSPAGRESSPGAANAVRAHTGFKLEDRFARP